MKSSFKGFDKLQKELKRMQRNVNKTMREFNGDVPLEKLFTTAFIAKHTAFDNYENWLSNGGFVFETQEEYNNLDETALDSYVRDSTCFQSWKEMLDAAASEAITASLDC